MQITVHHQKHGHDYQRIYKSFFDEDARESGLWIRGDIYPTQTSYLRRGIGSFPNQTLG